MSDFDYDLFVIGGGSGGVRAARKSASFGAKVALAEEYRLGGTCVIRGCVPKKLFKYASHFGETFEDAAGYGWTVAGEPTFDWPTLIRNKDREIDRLNGIYGGILERNNVETFLTRATIAGPHDIRLHDEDRVVTARHILIATGATPFIPDTPGAELGITSNEAFHLEQLPKSIVIVGGGYIALEFASIFNGLGVETTVVYRGPQILRDFDDEVRDSLAGEMRSRGVDIRLNSVPDQIARSGEQLEINLSSGDKLHAETLMWGTGRIPNTDGLGLENAGLEVSRRHAIEVNEYSQSKVEHIYAVGDVTDRIALTPVAIQEGQAFAETVFNNNPTPTDHTYIPTAVFTTPEIGTLGFTEQEAQMKWGDIDVYRSRFTPMLHTLTGRQTKTLMKVLVRRETDRVVGVHILGDDAAEIIQAVAIAVRMGATKADFDATMALHPSAAEELVTMSETSQPWAEQQAAE